MEAPEVLLFPLVNEQGFRVVDNTTYQHMINTIVMNTVEIQEDYPDNPVWVIYTV